jgi:WD40 repeat protein
MTVHIWEVSTEKQLIQLDGHQCFVTSVSFSPDGLWAISGSYDETVRIWEVSAGKQLIHLDGHQGYATSVSFSPDGLRAISGSYDETAHLGGFQWEAAHSAGWTQSVGGLGQLLA